MDLKRRANSRDVMQGKRKDVGFKVGTEEQVRVTWQY
jgi:hypothetical protein